MQLSIANKKKLILTLFTSAFLISAPSTSYASKSEQMRKMTDQIKNSLAPNQWPIRVSVISDQDGPLKVWLGGTDYRLNAKKGQQHYLTYNEKISTKTPLFEVKALINGTRVVCKTKAGQQLEGKHLVLETGDTTSKSAKKIASQKFLEAIKITISEQRCRISAAYKVLTRQNPWLEDEDSEEINLEGFNFDK